MSNADADPDAEASGEFEFGDDSDGDDMGYGLPTPRDEDGDPLPVDHEFDYEGETVKIELVPPTLAQIERYEQMGDDASTEKLRDILDRHIAKPSIPASEMTSPEINCYMQGLFDYGSGGDDRMQQVREAVEAREGRGGGN